MIKPAYLAVGGSQDSSIQKLNNIVITSQSGINLLSNGNCFGMNCYDIFIGASYPANNKENRFGNLCFQIFSLGGFQGNTFGHTCSRLKFGIFHAYEKFGNVVANITFGNSADDLKSYFQGNIYEGPILGMNITTSKTTSGSNLVKGNKFCSLLAYTIGSTPLPTLDIDIVGQNYEIEYKRTGSKTITFN